ncbi:MAG TPA: DUF3175 domain-containing protein [Polyangiaceae bacterium]|jgi:hypothetical protein
MAQHRKASPTNSRSKAGKRKSPQKYWSRRVTQTSDALDLQKGVFEQRSARGLAASLKRSAERSQRRKSSPYRSAMSMLTFYINRAGSKLSPRRKAVLERAKTELRALFDRE